MDALVPARDERGPADRTARAPRRSTTSRSWQLRSLTSSLRHAVLGGITIAEDVIAPLDNPLVPITTIALGERLGATGGQAHHDGRLR